MLFTKQELKDKHVRECFDSLHRMKAMVESICGSFTRNCRNGATSEMNPQILESKTTLAAFFQRH